MKKEHPQYPEATWRLLLEAHSHPGALNMAIDEVLLRNVANTQSPPTVRLYQWSAPTLTLGRGQRIADVDFAKLQDTSVALLRRMTGGTAVLNDNVLSYTVAVTNNESRFTGTIAESYRAVSLALVMGLNLLGLKDAEVKELDTAPGVSSRVKPSPVCFEIPSHYEITVDGKKLVGSSQMRIRGGILQHGTLYLDGDIGEISCYLSSHPDPYRIRSKTITLREAIGHSETYAEVAQAFVHGFSAALNLKLANGVLQSFEQIQVGRLIKEKYANPAWTHRL